MLPSPAVYDPPGRQWYALHSSTTDAFARHLLRKLAAWYSTPPTSGTLTSTSCFRQHQSQLHPAPVRALAYGLELVCISNLTASHVTHITSMLLRHLHTCNHSPHMSGCLPMALNMSESTTPTRHHHNRHWQLMTLNTTTTTTTPHLSGCLPMALNLSAISCCSPLSSA
jgi:hypothetical protein